VYRIANPLAVSSNVHMKAPVVVVESNESDVDAFMAAEWPAHDADRGIVWDERKVVLVARADAGTLGAARGTIVGGLGSLKQILVKKEHAGLGIGSMLLGAFEARCRAAGCHKLRLETADYQARPFYERHGFALAATLTNDRFGRSVHVMEKRL
jgi:GNAT superfamily N-acetyltransferase